jgi:hypothetical protein
VHVAAAAEWSNLKALWERFQLLKAENEELNRKKCKPRRWGTKRRLVVPAARAKSNRGRGAPPGNRNAYKHGNYSQERLAFWAVVHAFLRTCAPARGARSRNKALDI